jgi:hypothetical protein
MAALLVGTVLALGALAFVLYPIFADAGAGPPPPVFSSEPTDVERAVDALREVEFDRATGKLSDPDYARLKAAYTADAVLAMRNDEAYGAQGDAAEALIERYRHSVGNCPNCGERLEPAAAFCSNCGRRLID